MRISVLPAFIGSRLMSKKLLFRLHKWFGLAAALFLLLQAVTGLMLVYHWELGEILDPAGMTRQSSEPDRPIGMIYDGLRRGYPDFEVQRLVPPRTAHGTYFAHMVDSAGTVRYASVDPGTAQILRGGSVWRFPLEAAVQIHFNLMAGRVGLAIAVLVGLVLLFMVISGLIVWWPKRKPGRWRKAFAVKWHQQPRLVLRQLHKTVGAVAALLLVILATTGVVLGLEPLLKASQLTSVRSTGKQPLAEPGLDAAIAQARARFPGRAIHDVRLPAPESFYVLFKAPEVGPRAVHYVRVDLATRKIDLTGLAQNDTSFAAIMLPIHTGELIGSGGQLLAFVTGLGLLALSVSGFIMWRQSPRTAPARRRGRDPGDPRGRPGEGPASRAGVDARREMTGAAG